MKNLVNKIKRLAHAKTGVFVVAIDGMCCSGKTSLAQNLQKELAANVISMDDFYLPKKNQVEGLSHMDFMRFQKEILNHIEDTLEFQPFDCKTQTYLPVCRLEKKNILIIEGTYSLHPCLGKYYDYAIWKSISKEEQRERLLKRNPLSFEQFLRLWIPLENAYFSSFQIEKSVDEKIIE